MGEAALLEKLAESVSDGERVDWGEVERSARDEEERALLRQLRVVSEIAGFHRSQAPGWVTVLGTETSRTLTPVVGSEPVPERWAHFEIRGRLGHGAFGEVFRAWDTQLHREVALKLLRPDESKQEGLASAVLREGRLLARVRHPNVAAIHGADRHEGRVGLWMEFIEGRTLEELLRDQGPLGAREAALVGLDLCRALAAVHKAGLVHRDVKAQNVMREAGGRILLMDFGAGLDLRDLETRHAKALSGTPLYMAPELLRGEPATASSDVYALGVLLYHLVTGTFPFHAKTFRELREAHERGQHALLRDARPDLPHAFVQVIERALEPEPEQRFRTAGALEAALEDALGSRASPQKDQARLRPARLAVAASVLVAAVAVVGIGIVWWIRQGTELPPDSPGNVNPASATAGAVDPSEQEATAVSSPYTIAAALHRVRYGRGEPLVPGERVAVGDELCLDLEVSDRVYVYVLNEDDKGKTFVLFPVRGLKPENPLRSGAHRLPGKREGKSIYWKISSQGGREHILILASRTPLGELESAIAAVPRPRSAGDTPYARLSEEATLRLRGIGELVEGPAPQPDRGPSRLFERAKVLAGRAEEARGVWIRQIDLENPGPQEKEGS